MMITKKVHNDHFRSINKSKPKITIISRNGDVFRFRVSFHRMNLMSLVIEIIRLIPNVGVV